MIMKRFCHAILACGVFAAIVAAVSCTKDATGGGGGGYDGEPEVNHDMDGILRRNYLWNEEYATLSPDFGLPYDEFLDGVLMRMRTNDLDKKFRNGRWQLYSNIQRLSPVSRAALSADIDSQFPKEPVYGFGAVSLAIISYTDNGGAERAVRFCRYGRVPRLSDGEGGSRARNDHQPGRWTVDHCRELEYGLFQTARTERRRDALRGG